jgi:hypothetical protein
MKNTKLHLSEWLSFFATIIASVALMISAWQAFMLRQHNRISVQPLIEIKLEEVVAPNTIQRKIRMPGSNFRLGSCI